MGSSKPLGLYSPKMHSRAGNAASMQQRDQSFGRVRAVIKMLTALAMLAAVPRWRVTQVDFDDDT